MEKGDGSPATSLPDPAKPPSTDTPVQGDAQNAQKGRLLRSAKKEWGLLGQSGELSLEELEKQPKSVGLVYDTRMLDHCNEWDPKHQDAPERLSKSYQRCQHHGLVERCVNIKARFAAEEEILTKHSKELYETVKSSAVMSRHKLMDLSSQYDGVYFHNKTYEAAMLAAGSCIELVDQVVRRKVRNGMALVRPPGHHATREEACGNCFFNNVALAATHALNNLGLERILIVDWDVHHGNGTQEMFYDDPRVLYFSIHRYEHGNFWPNLRESDYDFVGENEGTGYNINMPLNDTGLTDGDYISMLQQVLMPVAYEFNPELVLVSAGYDTVIGDAEGENNVSPVCFAHMTHMLKALAGGRLCAILEGGYCVSSLAEAVALTLRELLGDPCPLLDPLPPPKPSTIEVILQCIRVLGLYWHCFTYHQVTEAEEDLPHFFRDIELPKQGVQFSTSETKPDKYEIHDDYIIHSEEKQAEYEKIISALIENENLDKAAHRTCLVYDERMRKHKCITNSSHPERPDRISRIYEKHEECGLEQRCKRAKSREATEEELSLTHKDHYVKHVTEFQTYSMDTLLELETGYNSVYMSEDVYECASLAAGCTLSVVDEVMSGKCQNGVCIVRPPGHHAENHTAMGFCYFNNVAIAARYAQQRYNISRVLILDWDVHHGNGTQHIFENDPSVLYVSLHRHDNGFFFPAGGDGNYTEVGRGAGRGYNVNVSWDGRKHGDTEYIAAFQQIVMPIAYEFSPELVLVSAGFDAAKGDPLGGCRVTPTGYAHMTHMLSGLAGGRVILVLEGGYNLFAISESMAMCTSILLGDLCPSVKLEPISDNAVGTIQRVLDTHQKFWKSIRFGVFMPSREATELWLAGVQSCRTGSKSRSQKPKSDDMEELSQQLHKSSVSDDESFSLKVARHPDRMDNMAAASPVVMTSPEVMTSGGGDDLAGACGGRDRSPLDVTIAKLLGDTLAEQENLQMYAVAPLSWCPHLDTIQVVPGGRLNTRASCIECENVGENWICLTCYEVHCSRYVNEHMLMHGIEWNHLLSISCADLSVWCYGCENYIHHQVLMPAKRAAHLDKFGEDLPGM